MWPICSSFDTHIRSVCNSACDSFETYMQPCLTHMWLIHDPSIMQPVTHMWFIFHLSVYYPVTHVQPIFDSHVTYMRFFWDQPVTHPVIHMIHPFIEWVIRVSLLPNFITKFLWKKIFHYFREFHTVSKRISQDFFKKFTHY